MITMKILSIRQPWASLIVNGYKEYEFRSWNTKFRGEFLIHASLTIEKDAIKRFLDYNLDFKTGCIIGKAIITDSILVTETFENELIAKNPLVYKIEKGRSGYAFKLENIMKFEETIPYKGQLGFFNYEG